MRRRSVARDPIAAGYTRSIRLAFQHGWSLLSVIGLSGDVYWFGKTPGGKATVEGLRPAKGQVLLLACNSQQVLDGKSQEEEGVARV